MRQMSDHDILFDAAHAEEVKAIMEGLGYTSKYFGSSNHDCYYKEPVYNFEMHRALFGRRHEVKLQDYYRNVKDRLIQDAGKNYGYHFSPEDFYIFMVAHEYKHYTAYAVTYPFFYKHKVFLPLLPFYRTARAMKAGRFVSEAKAIRNAKR